ncbi:acyltransferase ChoActase/COT/CPT [Exidia glandulosa HHB12029]|uniref:Carnitine O-acetyltransferase, mitochondrial n=1 Tax=Exidia glandulosa HHB12029 TaxID=1314781 RepID=A0A165QAY1_EXIGL|nr:acyltransferase ChoActase/COT/CPT [Exidia glandulosa HHB12029]
MRNAQLTPGSYAPDPSVGPMLRFERSLPRLPVPTLSSTTAKYLESVQPHLTKDEFAHTEKVVREFAASPLAKELQSRLEARAADPQTVSWLIDWWNDVAYMAYRDPVVVYVSYFFVHVDGPAGITPAARAASLLRAMLFFRELVETQQLEPDKVRDKALSMASFKWLFHACRYPVKPSDTAEKFDHKTHNHVVFVRKNKFYEVQLAHPDGKWLSTKELESQIQKVIDQAGNSKALPIGALTSDNRDLWADARAELIKSPRSAESLKRIESAMVVVALDDTKPTSREETSWACWTGDGRNRFYDKHQLIVFDNGRSGFLGEHSCMDGTPTLRMNEFMLGGLVNGKIDHGVETSASLPAPVELKFDETSEVKQLVEASEKRFDELISKHDLHVLHYDTYGKALIKTFKVSPDAWAQMVKQLAFQKMYGRPGVCYESCQTRRFALGRTEVIRSASNESKAWTTAMLDPSVSDVERARLFRLANARHVQYAAWAADGQGVDRHFFGLKRMLKEGEQLPEIYNDKAFSQTNHWELSTSQLSSDYIDGWGYGEVVEDGYGLSYAISDNYLRWTITSLKRDTEKLKNYLKEAADETRAMMERAAQAEAQKPKL